MVNICHALMVFPLKRGLFTSPPCLATWERRAAPFESAPIDRGAFHCKAVSIQRVHLAHALRAYNFHRMAVHGNQEGNSHVF